MTFLCITHLQNVIKTSTDTYFNTHLIKFYLNCYKLYNGMELE